MSIPDFDPLVSRPIDLPTHLHVHGPIDTEAADAAKIFAAPDDPGDWPAWRARLAEWRDDAWRRLQPDHCAYDAAATRWSSTCFSVALVWLWDDRLFDHAAQRFTPERFLAETADFGGFDAVVLWHAYPVIGIDARTQFDFYREVPGLADVVAWFGQRGVRVFVDYNPWDRSGGAGTLDHAAETARLVTDLGADGVFLDTMSEGGAALVATLRSLDPPAVLEGESRVPLARIADHQISWAQWFADSPAPGVLRAHWFERRHMQHHIRRWNRDHSAELQSSWTNGTGIVVWDAVFGSWVGWNARDRSTLRRMVRAQRALADVLLGGEWTPLVDAAPEALTAGVYASRWEHGPITLWSVVNRGGTDYTGRVLDVDADRGSWYDVTAGTTVQAGSAQVTVPARSVSGIVRIAGEVPPAITELVTAAAADPHPGDATFPARLPERVAAPRSASRTPPADAIILSPGMHTFTVRYRLRETGMYGAAPFVEEWKPLPPRLHADVAEEHTVEIGRVAVACCEVLVDGKPLTNVGLAEARAHAAALGARLPTEFEWQLAATEPGFQRAEPLVWNWTEGEHSDGVTRFVIVKGGSAHVSEGSEWYFDGGSRPPEFSAKLLLPGLGLDRSPSIGFRLAWDQ